MIFLSTTFIVGSAFLLILMAIVCFLHRRISSVVFLGAAAYAVVAAVNVEYLTKQFGDEVYLQMSMIYSIGSIVLVMSFLFFSKLLPRHKISMPIWDQSDFHRHATLALLFAAASVTLISIDRGEDLFVSWSEARSSSGFLTSLATAFFMLASPGIVSAFEAKRPALCVVLLLLSIGLFLVLGSRAAILGALIFWMLLRLARSRSFGSRLCFIAIATVLVFTTHTILRSLRGYGIAGLLQAFEEGNLSMLFSPFFMNDEVGMTGGESEIAEILAFSITQSSSFDFGFMTSIQRLILLPIPSVEGWLSKPIDVTNLLWKKAFENGLFEDAVGQSILLESYLSGSLGSWHPTLFGEYFLAGGWVALVLSVIVTGAILVAIDLFMHKADRLTSLALCGPILVGYLFVSRGNSVVGFGYFVHFSILIFLLRFATNFFRIPRIIVKRRVLKKTLSDRK